MTMTLSERHQASRITDYKDQINSALFQIHRILTTYFPDESQNIQCVLDIQNILDNNFNSIIDK